MKLLHFQREILEAAAISTSPPRLPAPPEIHADVMQLIDLGWLADGESSVVITESGRAVIEVNGSEDE